MASRKVNFAVSFVLTGLVLFGIVIFMNAILGSTGMPRIDLTEDQLYTVGPAAERILSGLKVPVQVKFYITKRDDMPTALKTLERDIVDKLKEFRVASGGKLSFSVLDPSNDDDLAEKIASKGIRPFQVQSIDRDEIGLKLVYSAMTVAYKEKDEEVIPQVLPQSLETLEYEICSAVTKLIREKNPVVALYASRPTIDPQMAQLYMQMGQQIPEPPDVYAAIPDFLRGENYDVRSTTISESSPIPEDASTLLVLTPRNLSDRQCYEINAFLQRGGSAFIAVQGFEFDYQPGRRGGFNISPQRVESGIGSLLAAYGVSLSDDVFLDNNMEVLSIPRTQNVGGLRLQVQEPVQAPIQIRVSEGQFNDDTSITNRIGQLLYLWGSRLDPDEALLAESGLEYTPLFSSSADAWEAPFSGGPLTNSDLTFDPDASLGRSPLAALLSGDLPNPYESGDIPRWSEADTVTVGAVQGFEPADARLIVVGSGKMFEDSVLRPTNNAMFLLNAIDALTLGDDIIQVRAKSFTQRVIEPVSEEKKVLFHIFTTVFVPVLVALYGIFRLVRRRRDEAAYMAAQSR